MSIPTDEHEQGIWLTQEAHDRLKAELDQLVAALLGVARAGVVRRRPREATVRSWFGDRVDAVG